MIYTQQRMRNVGETTSVGRATNAMPAARRSPASPTERARRRRWGDEWAQHHKDVAAQLRAKEQT